MLEGVDGLLIVRLYVLFHALVVHLAEARRHAASADLGERSALAKNERRASRDEQSAGFRISSRRPHAC